MRRILRIGFLALLGGLTAVGLLYQLMVPRGLPGLLTRVRPAGPFKTFKVGDKFPDLLLKTTEGTASRLSDHPHKLFLVNLFASW